MRINSDQPIILYVGEELLTPISPIVGLVLPGYRLAIGTAFDAACEENGLDGTLGQNKFFGGQWFLYGFQIKNAFLMPFSVPDKTSHQAAIDITYF